MAREATARLYDVRPDSVVLTRKDGPTKYANGTITFAARKGKLVDLDKLHESIWATRLSGGTRMQLRWLEVTVVGEVTTVEKNVILKVTGSSEHFVLAGMPKSNPDAGKESAFERLREALKRGEKVVKVTGRVEGWSGHFPKFLGKLPKRPRRILVQDFRTAKQ